MGKTKVYFIIYIMTKNRIIFYLRRPSDWYENCHLDTIKDTKMLLRYKRDNNYIDFAVVARTISISRTFNNKHYNKNIFSLNSTTLVARYAPRFCSPAYLITVVTFARHGRATCYNPLRRRQLHAHRKRVAVPAGWRRRDRVGRPYVCAYIIIYELGVEARRVLLCSRI